MKEILFRAKDLITGEWREGFITKRPSAIQFGKHYSPYFIDKPPRDPDDSHSFYNVEKETIGQDTGLTDRNGKSIFEGDILLNSEDEIQGIVEYDEEYARFVIITVNGELYDFQEMYPNEFIIIGNIHDNPELMP